MQEGCGVEGRLEWLDAGHWTLGEGSVGFEQAASLVCRRCVLRLLAKVFLDAGPSFLINKVSSKSSLGMNDGRDLSTLFRFHEVKSVNVADVGYGLYVKL